MAEALGNALLAAYGLAGRLLIPAIPRILGARARRGHEDARRIDERYGMASAPRPDGPLVWVHAASVGETAAVAPLVRKLAGEGRAILLSTVTVTGAATAGRLLPDGVIHQFAPLDVRPWVRRFLNRWRPDLAIFVESEIWPVTIDELGAAAIPYVIVNARLSERSFRRWRSLGGAARRVFGRIDLVLPQTEADAARFRALGAARVETLGNLKFDVPAPSADPNAVAALRKVIGDRPLWLAASTHPGEEAVAGAVHQRLRASHPDIVTAIVPRHPERGPAVREGLATLGLPVWLKTADGALPPSPSILVADGLGELGVYYRVAPVSFVGGSLVERGGQNPIEPVRLGSAVLHGPTTPNFADIYAALDLAGGAVNVAGEESLAREVGRLLADAPARRRQVDAAAEAIAPFAGALDRTIAALRPLLARNSVPAL